MIKIDFWGIIVSQFNTQGGHIVLLLFAALAVMAVLAAVFGQRRVHGYEYTIKNSVMSAPENEFYNILLSIVQGQYFVFPQVHLDIFLDHKVRGQSWKGALKHINQKSVDFLICDLENRKPLLAIELDERSHDREDRQGRDAEVERILREANFPLLRFANSREFNYNEISKRVLEALQVAYQKQT